MTSPHPEPAESRIDPDAGCPRAAFDAALVECRDELVEYLRSRLRDQETAADLAQETLSRMMKYRDSPEIEDRRLMLFRIPNNLINEHHRTRQRRYAGS